MVSGTTIPFTTPAAGDKLNSDLVATRTNLAAPTSASGSELSRPMPPVTAQDIDAAERSLADRFSIDPNVAFGGSGSANATSIRPTSDYFYGVSKSALQAIQTKNRITGSQLQNAATNEEVNRLDVQVKANEQHPLRQDYEAFLRRRDILWVNNPRQLLKNITILFPHHKLSWEGKVNAVTRFILVATLVSYIAYPRYKVIVIIGAIALFMIFAIAKAAQARQLAAFESNLQSLTSELEGLRQQRDQKKLNVEISTRLVPNTLDIMPDNANLPLPIESNTLNVAQRQLTRLASQDQIITPRRDGVLLGI